MIVYKNQIAREHNNIMELLTEMIAYIRQNTKLHVHTVTANGPLHVLYEHTTIIRQLTTLVQAFPQQYAPDTLHFAD